MAYRGAKIWNGTGWDDFGDPRVDNLVNRIATVESGRGAASGYASLDSTTRLPTAQLPTTAEVTGNKGANNGYCPLGSTALVPFGNLPVGTGSTQVAAGDHTHAAQSLTGVGAAFTSLQASNFARTSATTFASSSISWTGLAVGTWAIELFLPYTANSGGDIAFQLSASGLSSSYWSATGVLTASTSSAGSYDAVAVPVTTYLAFGGIGTTSPTAVAAIVKGFATFSSSGALTLQVAQTTSSTTPSTLLAGAWGRVTRLA